MSRSDSVDEVLLDPALNVDIEDVGAYNPDELPVNGHQYLHSVMKEADKLPNVVVAEVDRLRFKTHQTVYVAELETFNVSQKYLPSKAWLTEQVAAFDQIRQSVAKTRTGLTSLPDNKLPDHTSSDEEWYRCVWMSGIEKPSLQHMLGYNQVNLDLLLGYLCSWLEEKVIQLNSRTCFWIYSVLACLEIPLLPSTFASLRTLAQLAIKERAQTVQNESEANINDIIPHLNLLICIVGHYFKQTDLAD